MPFNIRDLSIHMDVPTHRRSWDQSLVRYQGTTVHFLLSYLQCPKGLQKSTLPLFKDIPITFWTLLSYLHVRDVSSLFSVEWQTDSCCRP